MGRNSSKTLHQDKVLTNFPLVPQSSQPTSYMQELDRNEEQSVEFLVSQNQALASQIIKELKKQADFGNRNQIRYLRQKLEKIRLQEIQAPYQLILHLMKTIQILFYQRTDKNDFLVELKHLAKFCRILACNFLGDQQFLQQLHQTLYSEIISGILKVLKQKQNQIFDFGFQVEIEIIDRVIKITQNEISTSSQIVKKACDLFQILYNKDMSKAAQFLKESYDFVERKLISQKNIDLIFEMELLVQKEKQKKEQKYDFELSENIERIALIFVKNQN